jgi:ribonuclease-3
MGGRTRPAILACGYEALVGAMLIDQGLEITRRLVLSQFELLLAEVIRVRLDRDVKSLLQEMVQGLLGITPAYRIISTTGPDHEPLSRFRCRRRKQVLTGQWLQQARAEQGAAAGR